MSVQPSPCFLIESPGQSGPQGFCPGCGTTAQAGAKFCGGCGEAIRPTVPTAKAVAIAEQPTMPDPAAGEPAAPAAPVSVPPPNVVQPTAVCHCKAPLPADAVFCPKCGVRVGETPARYWLTLITPKGGGPRCEITRDELTIGKDPACDVVLGQDEFISRRHARITRSNGMLFIEDLGSSNGTSLRVRRSIVLEPNDEIVIGTKVLRLEQSR